MYSPATSAPSSPSLAPQRPELQHLQRSFQNPNVPRRLLVPTTRLSRVHNATLHKQKPSAQTRLTKGVRSQTLQPEAAPSSAPAPWVHELGRFDVVQSQTEMDGYQIYAVEKWVVERKALPVCVSVFTGKPEHKITVTVLAPRAELSEHDAAAELEKAIQLFRKDGARPKETREGIIMVTSLATFRSDLNIVLVPDGNYMNVRERLYVNINLLRMGCSGRTVLNLSDPSEATQDRFRQMYCVPETKRPFQESVLDLVHIVQSGLAIFGFYLHDQDGLLCDRTMASIQSWNTDIAGHIFHAEFMERPLDPAAVAGSVTLIICIRNKLHILNGGQGTLRDPFDEPTSFLHALAQFSATTNPSSGRSTLHKAPVLTPSLATQITAAYDRARQAESYKIHRVVLNRFDSSLEVSSILQPTTDLAKFTKIVAQNPKEGWPASVRHLWTGHGGSKRPRRHTMDEMSAVRMEEPDMATLVRQQEEEGADGTDSVNWPSRPGRMKSFDMFSRNKNRRQGLDAVNMGPSASPNGKSTAQTLLPALVISGREELSAAEISPLGRASATNLNLSDDDLSGGAGAGANRLRVNPRIRDNIASWSGPSTSGGAGSRGHMQHSYTLPALFETRMNEKAQEEHQYGSDTENAGKSKLRTVKFATRLKRHWSFDDHPLFPQSHRLERSQLEIDFELAGELMQLRVRQEHICRLAVLVQVLNKSLKDSNAALKRDLASHSRALAQIEVSVPKLVEFATVESTQSSEAKTHQSSVMYRLNTHDPRAVQENVINKRTELWNARLERMKHRERPDGFSIIRDLQGREILVDQQGRTESEAEEEAHMTGVDFIPFPRDDEETHGGWWSRVWRERVEEPPLTPSSARRVQEADEAGLAGYDSPVQRPGWWGWLSTRRRLPDIPPGPVPTLVQKPKKPVPAERDLITFASDDEDEQYLSAAES
ncbi:hypothetical protein AURDEDRAFT_180156 [Auricularia subglabra TFB-10046 SS5]|nr:hypothetical protein AURDEDRAFT_180156 [Auricularia subglabra TFB-10046 SS5]